jgi:hypothetical protein
MWRKGKAKSAKRLASLGLLQDAMGRVEQDCAAAQDQEILQQQVPSQPRPPRDRPGPPREASTTGTGGAGW